MKARVCAAALAAIVCLGIAWSNDLNSGGQKGIVRSMSAQTFGKTGINVGGGFRYGQDMNMADNVVDESNPGVSIDRESLRLFSGNVYAAFGVTYFLDLSLDIPAYYDVTGWGDRDHGGIGDLELAAKLQYPWQRHEAVVGHAMFLKVILPTGKKDKGFFPRHTYYLKRGGQEPDTNLFTTNAVYWNPQLLWTVHFERITPRLPMQLHLNFGGVIAKQKSNSTVVAAIGLEYFPVDFLSFFTEISGESSVHRYSQNFRLSSFNDDIFFVTPGMRFNFPLGFYAIIAGDFGVSDDSPDAMHSLQRRGYTYHVKGTPSYAFQLDIGWNGIIKRADNDKDGIPNEEDKCIDDPEDIDGFEDEDGCPDIDNDGDGMLDEKDECPNQKAVSTGCPVFDADGDGIMDDEDKCPKKFEDKDGFEDEDGCPDPDNDDDGILDGDDKCPNKAEDMDGFEDTDGCPDLDNDNDGIMDEDDECPNHKGKKDNNGCPVTEEIREPLILDGVTFRSGKSRLDPNSYTILDNVVKSLKEWPEVKVEIRGYTDSQGSERFNMKLSRRRAEAVMRYFINKGISSSRLEAEGYGEQNPIADNNTAEGRERNRRVELHPID